MIGTLVNIISIYSNKDLVVLSVSLEDKKYIKILEMELKSNVRERLAALFRCLTILIGILFIADELVQIYLVKTNFWQHDRKSSL